MRPYLLKGHERPLTYVCFNREGDLLFTMAKDKRPTVWWSDDGQRFGTYVGHEGAVFQCAVTQDSSMLATASADSSVRLWNVTGGNELFKFEFDAPCRSCSFSLGEKFLVTTQDKFMEHKPHISILKIADDIADQGEFADPVQRIEVQMPGRVTRAVFSPVNDTIITTHEDGHVRRWDVETGKLLADKAIHEKIINDLSFSADYTHFITASTDTKAKLIDTETFEVLKTYNAERPCNSADISPIVDHVVIAGGQDAASVTTTASKAGKFESAFFHKIYEEEFGSVRGHFGPVNSICFSPDGRKFVTGGEDGYVRINVFDSDYYTTKFF